MFAGEILAAGEVVTQRSRRRMFEVIVGDQSGRIALKWFHYRKEWLTKRLPLGRTGVFSGEVRRFGLQREVHHPEVELLAEGQTLAAYQSADPLAFGRILPVYPLTEGLSQQMARRIWKQAVDLFAAQVATRLSAELRTRRGLLPLDQALQAVHWPESHVDLEVLEAGSDPARRTLVYDEFFFLQLGLALRRRGVLREPGIPFKVTHRYTKPLADLLPYRLTAAQRRVLGEIKHDLMAPHPMNRLVQGDVGCGKTVVALMAALLAIENDTQVAVVAPTEILAEQHFLQFHPWLEQLGLKVVLLRGQQSGCRAASHPGRDRQWLGTPGRRHACRAAGRGRVSSPRPGDHRRAAPLRRTPAGRTAAERGESACPGDDGHPDSAHPVVDGLWRPGPVGDR